jgi:mannose-6-phosphate isomerase-like protein (cupin superfamily)
MIIKDVGDCREITAGDGSALRELLHPAKGPFACGYSLAEARVSPGQATLPHRLKASEVYFILEGRGRMRVDEESAPVAAGQAVYIPPLAVQSIENTGDGDLKFLCLVDPAWRPEEEEILPGPSSGDR